MIINTLISTTPPAPAESLHTLRNKHDMRVTISDRGAALVSWWAPDRYGRVADVLLGYADLQDYVANTSYFGAIVGRWANRISEGRFSLDGSDYLVDRNEGENHLHGGLSGFHQALWQTQTEDNSVRFTLESPSGDSGFPGNLHINVWYRLDDFGRLAISYEATTDAPTPINLTAHPYFNLNGGSADISDHLMRINADHYLKTDAGGIPVDVAAVAGSAFDFRQPAPIGPRLAWPDAQIALAGGFDHCYCVRREPDAKPGLLREVARVDDPGSGRRLSVATTEAGLQFYSGNYLGGVKGRGSQPYTTHAGFCLEAQAFPNQINGPEAEAVVLRPGEVYRQRTVYRLTVQA